MKIRESKIERCFDDSTSSFKVFNIFNVLYILQYWLKFCQWEISKGNHMIWNNYARVNFSNAMKICNV